MQKETATEFVKSLTKTDDRIAQIAGYHRRLNTSVASFQVHVFHKFLTVCQLMLRLSFTDYIAFRYLRLAGAKR